MPVWSVVLVFEAVGEVGEVDEVNEVGEEGGGSGMGGRDQLHLAKILVTMSILESENVTVFLRVVFLERSETFHKTFVKLERAMKQSGKMLLERNFQMLSFNMRSIKLVVKNYETLNEGRI